MGVFKHICKILYNYISRDFSSLVAIELYVRPFFLLRSLHRESTTVLSDINNYNTDWSKLWVYHIPTEDVNAVNERHIIDTETPHNRLNFSILGHWIASSYEMMYFNKL